MIDLSEPSIKAVVDIASPLLALIVFGFGVVQYHRAQAWKRTEYARTLLDRLAVDPDLATCRMFMDWSPRRIRIPEEYMQVMKTEERREVFVHTWDSLHDALTKTADFNLEEVMYRDKFDVYFTYLLEIKRCIDLNLVSCSDLVGLRYWMEKIATLKAPKGGRLVFQSFVERYYRDLVGLMTMFGFSWATGADTAKPT